MRRTPGLAVLLAVLSGACVAEVTAPDRELPEDRGAPTGSAADPQHAFAWTPTGDAIVYVTADAQPMLARVPVNGGPQTPIDGPRSAYGDLAVSADGQVVYAVADTGGAPVMLRIGSDTVSLGTPAAGTALTPADGALVLPSADGAYYVLEPDSIFRDGAERTLVARGCSRLIALSPDGAELLCRTGATYRSVDLATGEGTPVNVLPPADGVPLLIDWSAGLRVFYRTPEGYAVRDVDAGTSVTVWRARPGGAEVPDATRASWSPDGSRIAFWTHACIEGDVGACTRGQSSLHVLDPFDGAESIVAVAHGDAAGEYLAFSPDGARIAYVFGGMIYSVPAP